IDSFSSFVVLCLIFTSLASAFNLMCYVDEASRSRAGPAQFDASKIDVNLCTHLVAVYGDIQNNVVMATIEELSFFDTLTANPDLKVLFGVGGADFDTNKFSTMAASTVNRNTFIQSVKLFLRENNFDGILLDWRYPDTSNSKNQFTALCQEMASVFDSEPTGGNERLLLTAAVSGHKDHMDASYDVPQLNTHLDLIHVMAHDFYNLQDRVTRHHAPLFQGSMDTGNHARYNEYSMMYWKNKGASAEKVLMGITTYGRTFTLRSRFNRLGSRISGPGEAGTYTGNPGYLSNYEICSHGLTTSWSEQHQVPYGYSGSLWVGYDNQESIATFVIDYGFGGAAVWSLDQDDFNGDVCDQGPYPLVSQLYDYLEADDTSSSSDDDDDDDDDSNSSGGINYNFCQSKPVGYYSVSGSPRHFYQCFRGITYVHQCAATLKFYESCTCCNY
uniref:Chitinase-3-like protein 1 n=1 Tax=Cynoglossus semilaevis TaxID=244447 RepID=A0A3P8WSB1_CYNSE